MEEAETSRKVKSFFIMDENFLLQKQRAMELLARMKAAGKSWAFNIFSSANAIRKYSYEELVELGISSIWLGLESPHSNYAKLDGADTLRLTRELREHGIVLLGSTIIGLEHHTPENITEEIEHAIAHETDLHQFMLYTPVPGTPLYRRDGGAGQAAGRGPGRHSRPARASTFEHAAISREESKKFLDWAFRRDFERNGPSLFRICRTIFEGWKRYKNHPDLRVRERFQPRDAAAAARLCRHAVGHGAPAHEDQPLRGAADPRVAQGPRAGIRVDCRRGEPHARPAPLVDQPARREAPGAGPQLRTGHHHRTPQLGGHLDAPFSFKRLNEKFF